MKKLPLIICGDKTTMDVLTIGERKFYKVVFELIHDIFNTDMLSSLNTIGFNIREIEINNCYDMKLEEFQNILRIFPKAEKLTCDDIYFTKSEIDILEHESLNEVVLKKCSLRVNYHFNQTIIWILIFIFDFRCLVVLKHN